jgi:Domain of unknown function (DUF6894)
MPLFYFDVRDGEKFTVDEQGQNFNGIEDARDTATLGLAKMAREVLPGPVRRRLAVEVRDDKAKEPLLVVALMFEVVRPRQRGSEAKRTPSE